MMAHLLQLTFIVKGFLYIVSSIVYGIGTALYFYSYYKYKPSKPILSLILMLGSICLYCIFATVTPILAMVDITAAVWYSNLSSILSITPMIYGGYYFIRQSVDLKNGGKTIVDCPDEV